MLKQRAIRTATKLPGKEFHIHYIIMQSAKKWLPRADIVSSSSVKHFLWYTYIRNESYT